MELTSQNSSKYRQPLSDALRPRSLDEFLGQKKLLSPNGVLLSLIENGKIPSMLFFGPPGTGKTTLARIIATRSDYPFVQLSAIHSGVRDLKKVFDGSRELGTTQLLFVDEIHRFNKAQQDVLLPAIEAGLIIFIGATTENPGFEINRALLSRLRVFTFAHLEEPDLISLLEKACAKLNRSFEMRALEILAQMANGDARFVLNSIECLHYSLDGTTTITRDVLKKIEPEKLIRYDKGGDYHYDLISALHKSMRGSDIQASLYWGSQMLQGGEPPLYLFRRLIRFAMEDVGLADPDALARVLSCKDAFHTLGEPEGLLAVYQAIIYLAAAPKSNAVYLCEKSLKKFNRKSRDFPVPNHLRNAPTKFAKDSGMGQDYLYPHDYPYHYVAQNYSPQDTAIPPFYRPGTLGFEKEIRKRMNFWQKLEKK